MGVLYLAAFSSKLDIDRNREQHYSRTGPTREYSNSSQPRENERPTSFERDFGDYQGEH